MHAIAILKQDRRLIAKLAGSLSNEQFLVTPDGFRNNILWNLGHIIVTQQILHYKLSGQEMYVSSDLCDQCRSGTSPADWNTPPDIEDLKTLLVDLPQRLEEDYRNHQFDAFRTYTTSTGITLENIDEAISFNNFHEGVHCGTILALRKLVV